MKRSTAVFLAIAQQDVRARFCQMLQEVGPVTTSTHRAGNDPLQLVVPDQQYLDVAPIKAN